MISIDYKIITADAVSDVLSVYNSICAENGIYFKPLDAESAHAIFFAPGRVVVMAYDGEKAVGFAAGSRVAERSTAYLTYVGVLPDARRRGVGSELLRRLEGELLIESQIAKIDIVFHNPASLPWFIPDGNGADHPCAPGVDVSSDAYLFLKNSGYRDWCMQNSYYLALENYREPADMAEKRLALMKTGIEVTLYDREAHSGLYELFDDIGNSGWRDTVMRGLDKPIIVAIDHNAGELVCGYTGPLSVQASGRGNFCGIGTRKAYRGRGIGKVIFCEMCRRHSEAGASFMSLYTGETNPARNIYEAAGFKIVRTWANMRKEGR